MPHIMGNVVIVWEICRILCEVFIVAINLLPPVLSQPAPDLIEMLAGPVSPREQFSRGREIPPLSPHWSTTSQR